MVDLFALLGGGTSPEEVVNYGVVVELRERMKKSFHAWYAKRENLPVPGQTHQFGDIKVQVLYHNDDAPGFYLVVPLGGQPLPTEGDGTMLGCAVLYHPPTVRMAEEATTDPKATLDRFSTLMIEWFKDPANADLLREVNKLSPEQTEILKHMNMGSLA